MTDSPSKGFLMKFRKKKSKKSKKNADAATDSDGSNHSGANANSNAVGSTNTNADPALQTRRVIKATPPPPPPPSEEPVTPIRVNGKEVTGDQAPSSKLDSPIGVVPSSSAMVQNETLKEKTEQWRQDRLDASAAIRKEHKEREVMEHRRRSAGAGGAGVERSSFSSTDQDGEEKIEIPAALSVSSKFPEHKRKARSTEHDTGKKARSEDVADEKKDVDGAVVSSDTSAEKDEELSGKQGSAWKSKAAEWAKASAPGVIAAVAVIVVMKLFRKR